MIFTTDMSYANHILEPDPIQQAEDAQLYRYVLHKLLHLGTDLIHILQAQATAHAHAAMQAPTPTQAVHGPSHRLRPHRTHHPPHHHPRAQPQ